MKKPRLRTILIFGFAGASSALLLYTSQNVQQAEDRLRGVQASVKRQEEAIRVLKAEWAYLNTPERLEYLVSEYLDLEFPDGGYAVSNPATLPNVASESLSEQAGFQNISDSVPAPDVYPRPQRKPQAPAKGKSFNALLDEINQRRAP